MRFTVVIAFYGTKQAEMADVRPHVLVGIVTNRFDSSLHRAKKRPREVHANIARVGSWYEGTWLPTWR